MSDLICYICSESSQKNSFLQGCSAYHDEKQESQKFTFFVCLVPVSLHCVPSHIFPFFLLFHLQHFPTNMPLLCHILPMCNWNINKFKNFHPIFKHFHSNVCLRVYFFSSLCWHTKKQQSKKKRHWHPFSQRLFTATQKNWEKKEAGRKKTNQKKNKIKEWKNIA